VGFAGAETVVGSGKFDGADDVASDANFLDNTPRN
jgi:hypothetical protein